ncbi:hypothetical protein [Archangium sp.]|uniref:hypothetical protein n=1 Tax=Archangium sp. TaxID=1872627 RepID=UPI003899F5F1
MNSPIRTAALAATAFALLAAPEASATNYSLWIHGKNGGGTQIGNYADFSNWGPSSVSAGVNKKAVNWNGSQSIASQNGYIRNALDCFCTGTNWCYIAVHSAGDMQIGYTLALYGSSARNIKNATPGAGGVCGDAGGTQTGWNIKWVDVASGAGGGSELADNGDWAVSDPIVTDLKTGNARAKYNHNVTGSKWFYMFAASKGTAYSGILPGQDDEAVAYHSTGGVSVKGSFCNPGDWFCDGTLNTGTAATSNGKALWSFHTVSFRDSNESYNHYQNGNWENIVGVVRQDMATYAY